MLYETFHKLLLVAHTLNKIKTIQNYVSRKCQFGIYQWKSEN